MIMNKLIYFLAVCACFLLDSFSLFATDIKIIPYPSKVVAGTGEFTITANTKIVCDPELSHIAAFCSDAIREVSGMELPVNYKKKTGGAIVMKIDKKQSLPEEGYSLRISPEIVEISASSVKGIFYGLQSLRQLMSAQLTTKEIKLPAVEIEDSPRFGWRGLMLDVSRTFMDKTLVKRYIDLLAFYKLNVLHFHLTDDQGWRVEIKQYPKLTQIGSKFDPKYNAIGGYYTQEDIRELVRYATARNITIVPEIEMPGHECAAIASYPELSCAHVRPEIHTFLEGPSVHPEIFCAGKPEVYEFIFNVLDEIMELFPSKYIHIGGDEAPKDEWKKCSHCQNTIKENQLANEEELQSHFVKRVGEYIRSKNRILIGWDEIIDGKKLSGDEVIMFWRGWGNIEKEINRHASNGFKIIASPTTHCYFDYPYENIDTKKIYEYEPIPAGTSPDIAANYIGVQANFWSHIDRSESRIDKQLFPRILGLAETGWNNPENKDWNRFSTIAKDHVDRLRNGYVNCYPDESLK